jgi:hypothetical protein
LILAGIFVAGAPLTVDSTAPCEGPNKIDEFAVQTDVQLKRMKASTFAETYSLQGPIWREVKPEGRAGTVATVYVADGIPAAAFFTIQTLSGDWVLYASYYFRPDGSLAKMHERLNTFRSYTSAVRDTYFGCQGESFGGAAHHLDLKTGKPKQPDGDFIDERAPVFIHARNLPFFTALKRR